MDTFQIESDDEVILVELAPTAGVRSVSLSRPDLIEKSQEAIEHAMKTVQRMANKTMKTIKNIPVSERPTTFEIQFGLKLNAEGNALITKAGGEAAINITLTWEHKSKAK